MMTGYELDPYANYSDQDLIDYLKRPNPLRPPGEAYAYSNVGTAILGWVLSQKLGLDYPSLIASRILEPLALADTTVHLSEKQRLRKAQGYLPDGTKTRGWTFQAMAPAGAIHSVIWLVCISVVDLQSSPLQSSMSQMLSHPTRPTHPIVHCLLGLAGTFMKNLTSELFS